MPMKSWDSTHQGLFSDKAFLVLVVAVSLAFVWIVWPFFGAVFWATVLAILFAPLYRQFVEVHAPEAHACRGYEAY